MHFFLVVLLSFSLSMDAFSLSLAYGTMNFRKKKRKELSFIVGSFHFFMPLLGHFFGDFLFSLLPISPNWVIFFILLAIGVQMILDSKKEESVKKLNLVESLLFALAVSFDSFSVGIGLITFTKHIILASILFSIVSAFFTYLGFSLGGRIEEKIGKRSTILGGVVLIIIGILALF